MRKVFYILGQLSDLDVEWLANNGEHEVVYDGEVILREGKAVDKIFFLLDGMLSVILECRDGKETNRLKTGEVVGEMSFVDASPASATVKAIGKCSLLSISKDKLSKKMEEDVAFAMRFYKAIAVFLADRLRKRNIDVDGGDMPEGVLENDELDQNVLDNVHLAGIRFDSILKKLKGDY